jgi:hypothetical protein
VSKTHTINARPVDLMRIMDLKLANPNAAIDWKSLLEKEGSDIVAELTQEPPDLKTHNYKTINTSFYDSIDQAANVWAHYGWRVVGAIGSRGPGYANQLILERPIDVTHPSD